MNIFRRKNNKQLEQIDLPSFAADTANDSPISPMFASDYNYVLPASVQEINYVNQEKKNLLDGKVKEEEKEAPKVSEGLWLMDIAQSHHFTVQISDMDMSRLRTPKGSFSEFLPVKTMNLKYTSYENMSIPVAIFGDFPLLNKKRVSTIDLSCFDYDNNKLEYELRKWEASCFPKGRFVAYMTKIARKFTYRGYSVDGKQTLIYEVYVIPAGNVSVSRDYSANEAKMVNFSLVCVGDGRTCSTGDGKQPKALGVGPIVEDHTGAGDGRLPKGPFNTLYATGYGQWNKQTESFDAG